MIPQHMFIASYYRSSSIEPPDFTISILLTSSYLSPETHSTRADKCISTYKFHERRDDVRIRTYSYAFNDKVYSFVPKRPKCRLVYSVFRSSMRKDTHYCSFFFAVAVRRSFFSLWQHHWPFISQPNQAAELKGNSNSTSHGSSIKQLCHHKVTTLHGHLKSSAHSLVVAAFSSKEIGLYRSIFHIRACARCSVEGKLQHISHTHAPIVFSPASNCRMIA